jgi:hypothetical protein
MPDCPASSQSGTGMTKVPVPEPVRCRNKVTQPGTGMLQYWTQILDAEMPMPSYGILPEVLSPEAALGIAPQCIHKIGT